MPLRIKRISALTVPLVATFLLASCMPVFSLHPLYTDKDVYFEPSVLGTWLDTSDSSQSPLTFERAGANGYLVSWLDTSSTPPVKYTYKAHLLKLGGRTFIDAVQSDTTVANGNIDILAVPGHMLGEVSLDQDNLTIRFVDNDWMQKALKSGAVVVSHYNDEDGTPILTATTSELQAFVLAHADDAKAFSFLAGPLRRKK